MRSRSLWLGHKILLSSSLLISLLVVGSLLAVNIGLRASTAGRTHQDLQRGRLTFETFLKTRFESLRLLSKVVVESPRFKSVVGTPGIDHPTALVALQEMNEVVGSDLMTVTDREGRVLARIHAPSRYGDDLSAWEGIREALHGEEHLHLQVQDGRLYQMVTLPVVLNDVVEGTLSTGFVIDESACNRIVEMIGGDVGFIGGNRLLAHSSTLPTQARFEYLLAHQPALLESAQKPDFPQQPMTLEFSAERYLTLIFPLRSGAGEENVLCVIERSLTEALTFYRQQVQGTLIPLGLIAIVVAVLSSLFLARSIARPIRTLTSAAEAVAQGDFSQRVEVRSSDEVGILGDSFNRMVEELRRTRDALLLSKEYTENIIRSMIDTLIVVDRNGCIQTANPAALQLLGYRVEDLIGKPARMILDEPDQSVFRLGQVKELLRTGSVCRYEMAYRTRSGDTLPVSFHGSVLRDKNGRITGILGIARDIREIQALLAKEKQLAAAEKKRAEELEEARRQLDHYSKTLEEKVQQRTAELAQANEELKVWAKGLERHSQEMTLLSEIGDMLQTCLSAQEAYSSIANLAQKLLPDWSGALSATVAQQNQLEVVTHWGGSLLAQGVIVPNDCLALRRGRMYVLEETREDSLLCQHLRPPLPACSICVPLIAQGETLGVLHLGRTTQGTLGEEAKRLIGTVARTIGLGLANLQLRESLQEQSIRDPLTGLLNRRYMEEALALEARRAERNKRPLGIMMLDIDFFKKVNDTYGHDAGDALLRSVGAFLQEHARGGDIACRYGGEEFTVILPGATMEIVHERAEQIRSGVKQLKIRHGANTLEKITLSVGIAVFPEHGTRVNDVLQCADGALYRAKQEGRDRVVAAESGVKKG